MNTVGVFLFPWYVRTPRDAAVARKIGPGRSLVTVHPGEQGRLASMSVSHLYSATSTRSKTGPLTIDVDEAADERVTGSLLWPIRPTWATRGGQAHSQGLRRLDQRLERIGLPYCRAHAENWKVPGLGVVQHPLVPLPLGPLSPGLGQPAQRSQQASASVEVSGLHYLFSFRSSDGLSDRRAQKLG